MADDEYRRHEARRDDERRYRERERREVDTARYHGIRTGDYSALERLLGVSPDSQTPLTSEATAPPPTFAAILLALTGLLERCTTIGQDWRWRWHIAALQLDRTQPEASVALLRQIYQELQYVAQNQRPPIDIWNIDVDALLTFDQEIQAIADALNALYGSFVANGGDR